MRLTGKLRTAALLAPAIWLVLLWIFYVSTSALVFDLKVVLVQTLAIAYVASYCAVLFFLEIRSAGDKAN